MVSPNEGQRRATKEDEKIGVSEGCGHKKLARDDLFINVQDVLSISGT